jgi:hypothetical protein
MLGSSAGQAGHRRLATLVTLAAVVALASGCARSGATAAPLLLGGPNTNITVAIPSGWHQVIDSANTQIPQMVAPVHCMGSHEVDCALGLARVATMLGASEQDAEHTVERAVLTSPGVTPGPSLSAGVGKVGSRTGYRHRFVFSNSGGSLTCEIAAVASGPPTPDPHGNREYSVILVWIADKPNAPGLDVIERIVRSADVIGGDA